MSNPQALNPALAKIRLADMDEARPVIVPLLIAATQEDVVVLKRGDHFAAFINRCPHARWPLDTFDGRFLLTDQGDLICAAHGALFNARNGACLGGPGTGKGLEPVPIKQVGDEIWIGQFD